jgi:hypothetical protein
VRNRFAPGLAAVALLQLAAALLVPSPGGAVAVDGYALRPGPPAAALGPSAGGGYSLRAAVGHSAAQPTAADGYRLVGRILEVADLLRLFVPAVLRNSPVGP